MTRFALLLPFVVAILLVIVNGFEFQNKYCHQQKPNITFGQRKSNDTLLLQRLLVKKGIRPEGKTSAKLEWFPQNIWTTAELRPTFINIVDKGKLCGCNNTVRLSATEPSSKNIKGLEIFANPGCPINTLVELWGKNEVKPNLITEE